jgi:hypothetical protein
MTSEPVDQDSFSPLPSASFHILMVLVKGENHGYGIMREIDKDTNGRFRIGPGSRCPTAWRLPIGLKQIALRARRGMIPLILHPRHGRLSN